MLANMSLVVKCTSYFLFLPQSSSCSLENPMSCVVGEISARQGPVSLTEGQLYSDSIIQLSGDNTSKTLASVK